MEYAVIFLIFSAWWSYMWESVLAPSIREQLRLELFGIRDDLRKARIKHGEHLSKDAFLEMQERINWAIGNLHQFTISELRRVLNTLRDDEGVRAEVERRREILDRCNVPEIENVRWRASRVLVASFGVNAGGWLIFIVPWFVVGALLEQIKRAAKAVLVFPASTIGELFDKPREIASANRT